MESESKNIFSKKIFGVLNIVDITVLLVFAIGLVAVFLIKGGAMSAKGQAMQNTVPIEIDVLLEERKISNEKQIFVSGEKTFLTIRNVPYTALNIVKSAKTAYVQEGKVVPYTYNFLVTVKDDAVNTEDGPVIGGNKIKIGLPIILEGYDYKLGGVVSDVRVLENK